MIEIYYGELTVMQMEEYGATYRKCGSCGGSPLIWQQTVGDGICENCGSWENGE
jgi:hypothetical protein